MNSDLPSPNQESKETKAEFRKPTNDAAHRKYRRHSPIVEASDDGGSPERDHSLRGSERRNDDRVDDKRSSRSQLGRGSDSYRYSSRGNRHDEFSRFEKHADLNDRSHVKSSSQSDRESRGDNYIDSRGRGRDSNKPRDRYRDVDRYSRDRTDDPERRYKDKDLSSDRKYDGRHGSRYEDSDRHARGKDHRDDNRDYRSSRDHKSDRPSTYEDSVGRRTKWETGAKDSDGLRRGGEQSYKKDQLDKDEDGLDRAGSKADDRSASVSEAFATKRPKLFSSDDTDTGKDETSNFKVLPEQTAVNGSDSVTNMDAAKVAAIKAAELVNKNLTGSGIMTADQKKKLLWGKKKSTAPDESSNRWDSAMFSDRERQEKFNKLMSLRLPWYIWPIVGCEGRSQGELETSKWSRCREAGAGFGEAIYRRPSAKRRPHCGSRSVRSFLGSNLLAVVTFYLVSVALISSLTVSSCMTLTTLLNLHSGCFVYVLKQLLLPYICI